MLPDLNFSRMPVEPQTPVVDVKTQGPRTKHCYPGARWADEEQALCFLVFKAAFRPRGFTLFPGYFCYRLINTKATLVLESSMSPRGNDLPSLCLASDLLHSRGQQ